MPRTACQSLADLAALLQHDIDYAVLATHRADGQQPTASAGQVHGLVAERDVQDAKHSRVTLIAREVVPHCAFNPAL
jgi:hypothetical protein